MNKSEDQSRSAPREVRTGTAALVTASALALTLGAARMTWQLLVTIDWTLWSPGDATVTAAGVIGSLIGGRFLVDVVAAAVQSARGRRAPRWSGRLARSVAAALVAMLAGAGVATAADQTPSAGWLPADDASPRTGAVSTPVASPPADASVDPSPDPNPAPDPRIVPSDGFASPFGVGAPELLRPAAPPARSAMTSGSSDEAPGSTTPTYRVQRGDSLWRITASLLGGHADDATVAAAWPELYRENRTVIGEDPSLILAGQVLTVPASLARGAR